MINRREVITAIGAVTLMTSPLAFTTLKPISVNINELIAKLIVSKTQIGRMVHIVPMDSPNIDIWDGDIITLPDGREFEFIRKM